MAPPKIFRLVQNFPKWDQKYTLNFGPACVISISSYTATDIFDSGGFFLCVQGDARRTPCRYLRHYKKQKKNEYQSYSNFIIFLNFYFLNENVHKNPQFLNNFIVHWTKFSFTGYKNYICILITKSKKKILIKCYFFEINKNNWYCQLLLLALER